jgi:aminoglycoside 6'-N-acetyltransferase
MKLRNATIDDLEMLKHWDEQPHVIAAIPDDDWNWTDELKRFPVWREQLIAEKKGRAIGYIQLIDPAAEESHYWGKVAKNLRALDIWIGEKADIGKGYGTEMMTLAINKCFENNKVTAILIDPLEINTAAIRFYERIGFEYVERRTFDNGVCLVYTLKRNKWQEVQQKTHRNL